MLTVITISFHLLRSPQEGRTDILHIDEVTEVSETDLALGATQNVEESEDQQRIDIISNTPIPPNQEATLSLPHFLAPQSLSPVFGTHTHFTGIPQKPTSHNVLRASL